MNQAKPNKLFRMGSNSILYSDFILLQIPVAESNKILSRPDVFEKTDGSCIFYTLPKDSVLQNVLRDCRIKHNKVLTGLLKSLCQFCNYPGLIAVNVA